jgi:hypothetical protein
MTVKYDSTQATYICEVYNSVRTCVLHNILIEFCIPMKTGQLKCLSIKSKLKLVPVNVCLMNGAEQGMFQIRSL